MRFDFVLRTLIMKFFIYIFSVSNATGKFSLPFYGCVGKSFII